MTQAEVKLHPKPSQKHSPESQELMRNFERGNKARLLQQPNHHSIKVLAEIIPSIALTLVWTHAISRVSKIIVQDVNNDSLTFF